MNGPLEGVKIIDLTSMISGPSATMILADQGADVVKIEQPEVGDDTRNFGPPFIQDVSTYFLSVNRGKRSITLDMKCPKNQLIAQKLAMKADVLVENFRSDVMDNLNMSADILLKKNPRLIYASLTGYGEVGPDADRTAYDSMAWWARSGLMDWVRPSDNSPVAWSTPGMGDHPTGMALYGAIITALYKRQLTGKGSEVSTSLMANGAWANGVFIQAALMGVEFADRSEPLPRHPFYDFYRTKDNREFALGLINATREWPKLAKAINRIDLLNDSRFEGDNLIENGYDICEMEWKSILFQICFGLSVAQKNYDFVHNDLHSSNIMFKETPDEYLYFKL